MKSSASRRLPTPGPRLPALKPEIEPADTDGASSKRTGRASSARGGVDSEAGVTWIPREEWIKTQPQALIAACVVLLDRQDRILLLRYGTGQPNAGHWWLPGGMLDHGEDPRTAAWRETHEETGVEISTELRLIGVDHRVNVCGTGPVLDCFFHGGTLPSETQIRLSPEHDQYAFFKADDLQDMMLAAPAHTLQALHEAATSGTAVYLREGQPV